MEGRQFKMERYESEAYKKHLEYKRQIEMHPVKWIEGLLGVKLKWHEKIRYFISYKIDKRIEKRKNNFDRLLNKYVRFR